MTNGQLGRDTNMLIWVEQKKQQKNKKKTQTQNELKSFSLWTNEQITPAYSLLSVCATCASDRDFYDIIFVIHS